jgi:hypothetical protein
MAVKSGVLRYRRGGYSLVRIGGGPGYNDPQYPDEEGAQPG